MSIVGEVGRGCDVRERRARHVRRARKIFAKSLRARFLPHALQSAKHATRIERALIVGFFVTAFCGRQPVAKFVNARQVRPFTNLDT